MDRAHSLRETCSGANVVQAPRIASEIRARIWEEFKKAGITTPHPIRTLELPPRSRTAKAAAETAVALRDSLNSRIGVHGVTLQAPADSSYAPTALINDGSSIFE